MLLYDIPIHAADGSVTTLAPYRGQVLLIVNVASRCGFTPQYEGLEALYRRHRKSGLTVLGFPCDQFGHQEPGSDTEIQQFCRLTYDVTFPVFAKIEVNGAGEHPLYHLLKEAQPGVLGTTAIKWNFTKFLVSRSGKVLERYAPTITPADLEPDILRALDEPVPAPAGRR
ncbi:MAG TPA: glutathione peroxidase [Gemmatimonadales bacterium]|nr:glutathione peroxidase [Gemmatimonadales bacterium]